MKLRKVVAVAPAKVNLHLGVGAPRPDGFHPLATVYSTVSLQETVTVEAADDWQLSMTLADYLPPLELKPEDNIVTASAQLLSKRCGVPMHARVHIDKQIPVAGGLAGGSADAAAALVALNRLWGLGLSHEELLEVGAELGSDVPFLLTGGTALGLGRGEVIERLHDPGSWWWVVVIQKRGLSAGEVYRRFDQLFPDNEEEPTSAGSLLKALQSGDPEQLGLAMWNDLEVAACDLCPDLTLLITRGESEGGAIAGIVSGSGPSTLFLCESYARSLEVAEIIRTDLAQSVVLTADGPVAGARVTLAE